MHSLSVANGSLDWIKDGGQFVPYPATWLNAKGWEDEIPPKKIARENWQPPKKDDLAPPTDEFLSLKEKL